MRIDAFSCKQDRAGSCRVTVRDQNTNDLSAPLITIRRADSDDSQFTFRVNTQAGATAYKAYKRGREVAASANNTVSVPAYELSDSALTELSARAAAGVALSDPSNLPAMFKYPEATKTLNGYTDWFNFLDVRLESLSIVKYLDFLPHVSFRKSIQNILDAPEIYVFDTEDGALAYKEMYKNEASAAMKDVLANFQAIMKDLSAEYPEGLAILKETMPRIWFNKVDENAANDAALNALVEAEVKEDYPNVSVE